LLARCSWVVILAFQHASSGYAADVWWEGATNGSLGTANNFAVSATSTNNPATTPGAADNIIFNMTAANNANMRLSMGSNNREYNSLIFNNAGTNTIMRTGDAGATNANANSMTLHAGITMNSGAGAFQLGDTDRKAVLKIGNTAGDFVIKNDSANSMTFQQQAGLTTAGTLSRTLVVSGSGAGNVIFSQGLENGSTGGGVLSLRVSNSSVVLMDASTYTGGTILEQGAIGLTSSSGLGTGLLTIKGGAIGSVTSTRTLANNIVVTGDFATGITAAGLNSQPIVFSGTVDLNGANRSINLASSSATMNGTVSNGGITLESSSATRKLTLGGANSYAGNTIVNGGTLVVGASGSINNSPLIQIGSGATLDVTAKTSGFTVGSAQALKNNGTVTGTLLVDGSLSGSGSFGATTIQSGGQLKPGSSPGIMAFNSNLTLNSGGSMVWELWGNTEANSPLLYDQVVVGGDLSVLGSFGVTLDFGTLAGGSAVNWSNAFWETQRSWVLFDVTGTSSGVSNLSLLNNSFNDANNADLSSVRSGASFSIAQVGSDVVVNYIPEPSTPALLVVGLLGLVGLRATRRRA